MNRFKIKKMLMTDTAYIEMKGLKPCDIVKYSTGEDLIIADIITDFLSVNYREIKTINEINLAFFERKYFTNLWFFDYNNQVPKEIKKPLLDYVLRYGIADKVIHIH
ncbi:MAG: hypothetical protein RSC93_01125 [Erysipelotrichaceae bacterium]